MVALAALSVYSDARATALVNLGSASGFAVLAGSAVTITDPTTIAGDLGTYPGTAITGLGNATLTGMVHSGDGVARSAQLDLLAAYTDAAGRAPTTSFAPAHDLGGATLLAGVYSDPSSLAITGTLTLDAHGDPNAVWIFQAGSTLITAADSQVVLTGGARAANVFWQVGSSTTLGTQSQFCGDILSLTAATLGAGVTVEGRILTCNAAVTLDGDTITPPAQVPDAGGTLFLFSFGLVALWAMGRQLALLS